MLYPTSIQVDEAKLNRLIKTYQEAYKSIYSEIATATNFGQQRRKTILAGIENNLKELGADTQTFIDENIPAYYKSGADDAVAQLKKIYAPVDIKTGFNRIHREAIAALVDDTAKSFADSLTAANRAARTLISDAAKEVMTQQLATGQISGDALKTIQKQIIATIQQDGLTSLKSKPFTNASGTVVQQSWSLDRYSEMLIRTKAVEARNTGLKNRLVENGYDLVQVSSHGATDVCGRWEGKILSLTGETKRLPSGEEVYTVKYAENDGLFHPNCKHAINGLTLELARETMAWNASTRQYEKGLIE